MAQIARLANPTYFANAPLERYLAELVNEANLAVLQIWTEPALVPTTPVVGQLGICDGAAWDGTGYRDKVFIYLGGAWRELTTAVTGFPS